MKTTADDRQAGNNLHHQRIRQAYWRAVLTYKATVLAMAKQIGDRMRVETITP